MSKKIKHRGRVFAQRLREDEIGEIERKAFFDGYYRGKKDGESITRYLGVRGLWQTRIHADYPILRINDARILEATQTFLPGSGYTKEHAEREARHRLAREIARMATIEHQEGNGINCVYARISIASVERAELPPMKYPFASEPHDSQTLEWHAF